MTWEVYEGFRVGEKGRLSSFEPNRYAATDSCPDSGYARDAFSTFIPIGAEGTRGQIIQDFFDLLAAVAAHGKANGLGGHKLSRYAGWWAFEQYDSGKGFESGYKSWSRYDSSSCMFNGKG